MTEKSKNWLYVALMMMSLWETGNKYDFFFTPKFEI